MNAKNDTLKADLVGGYREMAAAVDESPVWKPRTTMALTLPSQGHNHHHLSHSGHPSGTVSRRNESSGAGDWPVGYNAYNPDEKPRSDYGLSTFRPPPEGYRDGTWPRSGVRPSQSQSDPLLHRSTFGPTSPLRGLSLHPIREHHQLEQNPSPLRDDGSRTPQSPQLLPEYAAHGQLPSMKNGMTTTVPQNMIQRDLKCGQRPSSSRASRLNKLTTTTSRETWEVRCCRISVLLVIMQICLGVTVTALAFYMERLSTSIPTKECPYWAGIPVSIWISIVVFTRKYIIVGVNTVLRSI
ncbi:hypothetical protein LSH36_188g05041 [Paralvinella palmiformis]|uniref:Uncharacterized protein n=1 Tax=Paralvinella palmiformis TaxID=53620 RepID=A0AAD9JR04_9ANNE|nr:hypothetical protein LSH36_188g05041 [Paralvinella palmiformis]